MSTFGEFIVYGCHGILTVEVGIGKVLGYEPHNPDAPEYADIVRIDIRAYESASGLRINPGDHVCVMDLGFWSHDEQHFVPDKLTMRADSDLEGELAQPDVVCRIQL